MPQILLVNPFSSARYLSARFKEYGIQTVALYTIGLTTIPSYILLPPSIFNLQIKFHSNNLEEIIEKLGESKFDYVINGFELSVELSDQLAKHYTPKYANNPKTHLLRSDKYAMHKALQQKGLPHIHQMLYDTHNPLPKIADHGIDYPCFVKPLASATSLGANKIANAIELDNYFQETDKYKNFWQNDSNKDKFLISEYVEGQEFLVDTFSVNNQHYISTIQKYHKEEFQGRPIYCYFELERDTAIQNIITNYIKNVLDATEFSNGFAHTELFLLADNSVKLIEINPRVSGANGTINQMALLSNGADQISLLMKNIFQESISSGDGKHSRCLTFFNLSGEPLPNLKSALQKYNTVTEVVQLVPDGHIIGSLDNLTLADAVAFIILRSDSLAEIEQDTQEIFAKDTLGWN